jgi:membrane fusion protein, multidrug efflux system
MPKKLSALLLMSLGVLTLSACSEAAKQSPAGHPIAVQVITAQYQVIPASIEAPGTIQARNRIALSSQVNGFVRTVRVKAGDLVNAGQTLVQLDARDAESQKEMAQALIEEAQAALEEARKGAQVAADMRNAAKASSDLAEATFQRFQKMFDAKSVSPQELDEARARRDSAAADLAAKETMKAAAQDHLNQVQAKIAQARAQSHRADVLVGWTEIKAPAASRIAERQVDPGSAIFPGSPLMVLETTGSPQVLGDVPAAQLAFLRVGLEVEVQTADAGPATKGHIVEIVPTSNTEAHTIRFKVDLPSGFSAPTGSYAKVIIPIGRRNGLLVPVKTLRQAGQLTGIFVVDSASKARFRLVKTAPYDADRVELLSGLEQGERVIIVVPDELADGVAVEVRS